MKAKTKKVREVVQPTDELLKFLQGFFMTHRHLTKSMTRDTNHMKALYRGAKEDPEHNDPRVVEEINQTLGARIDLASNHKDVNATKIEVLVQHLPIADWVASVKGLGFVNVGLILGATGDLSKYANPAKVWKRMGLAVHTDGKAQRKIAGLSEEETLKIGYPPQRRAVMWNVGECLLKQNYLDKEHEKPGYYRALYENRFVYELQRIDQKLKLEDYDKKNGKHVHAKKKAKRYMEKRLLLNLWVQWNLQCNAAPQLNPGA